MEVYRENESVTQLILNLRARWKILVQIGANHAPAACVWKKKPVPNV